VKTRIRRIAVACAKAMLDGVALLFLVVARVSRPVWRLTVVKGTAAFYGHLALEPENGLCVRDTGLSSTWARQHSPRSVTWWNFGKPADSPNPTLLRMWKRSITIPPSWWIAAILRVSSRHAVLAPDIVDASLFGVGNALDSSRTHLRISPAESLRARRELEALGIADDARIVTFAVRDPAYFSTFGPALSNGAMRDRDIADFAPAALALAERGWTVVRLGHRVRSGIGISHPNVIDYATSGRRSELLDVILPLRSRFMVSTLTGPDAVALVGRRPVLYVDVPLYAQVFHSTELATWVPARLFAESGEMSLRTAFDTGAGWFEAPEEFVAAGVRVERSTPTEIAEYVVAFADELTTHGRYVGDDHHQNRYRDAMTTAMGERGRAMHGAVRSSIHEIFFQRNSTFLAGLPDGFVER
jgi:putative glycosyltransferase (TIGR04372 family)